MYLKYADNFSFTLSVAKAANVDYFTVDWVDGVSHTFSDAFGNNAVLYGGQPAFVVPITLVDGVTGAVKASGFASHWDSNDTGNENKIYLYKNDPYAIYDPLYTAAAVVGDKLECRMRAFEPNRHGSMMDVLYANTSERVIPITEHSVVDVPSSGGEIQILSGEYMVTEMKNLYYQAGFSIDPARAKYSIVLYDSSDTQPAVTWYVTSASMYDEVNWITGSPPAFGVGYNRILVELFYAHNDWIGRWTLFNL